MNVLTIAAEAVPFVKSGGLADVIGSLPKALGRYGADTRVMLPKYEEIGVEWRERMAPVDSFEVELGWRKLYCGVDMLIHEGVTYYFIDNEYYFCRRGLYGYDDDAERFAFFCKAALEAIARFEWKPDLLHCHDWHAALVPVLLRSHYKDIEMYRRLKSIFTIHNLKYQGLFPSGVMSDILNLGWEYFHAGGLEYYGNVNYLKGALNYSDWITTVSPTYAEEIMTPYFGEGLDGVIRYRKSNVSGIVNGIDYDAYDPMTDEYLFVRYRKSLKKKRQNKCALQCELGLPEDENVPLISVVSRLVEQKGIDLIVHVLDELLAENVQLVVLGAGEHRYESALRDAQARHPGKLAAKIMFNEELAHRIYAGSDLFLMPSMFEPCGIGQMIAMRYGAVPIVRETGGLKDTVAPYNEFTGEGCGFTFGNYNAHDMLFTVRRALGMYRDDSHWSRITEAIAKQDLSWNASAIRYAELYKNLAMKEASV